MKKAMALVAILALVLAGTVPALAQATRTVVDCVAGDSYCIGTDGDDTITGSEGQDVILGLGGDDLIDPGADGVQDFVFCGGGTDVVNQMPRVLPDDPQNGQGFLQYQPDPPAASVPDFIADDCETIAE